MDPFFHTGLSISDSLKTVRKSVLIYETIIMGGLKDTCGAVVGMFMTIGLANSAGNLSDPYMTKSDTYNKIMEAARLFEEKKGSLMCRDLLTDKGAQPLPCCRECVKTAVEVLEIII